MGPACNLFNSNDYQEYIIYSYTGNFSYINKITIKYVKIRHDIYCPRIGWEVCRFVESPCSYYIIPLHGAIKSAKGVNSQIYKTQGVNHQLLEKGH